MPSKQITSSKGYLWGMYNVKCIVVIVGDVGEWWKEERISWENMMVCFNPRDSHDLDNIIESI